MDTAQGLEGDSPEVIREQIERTRASLGQKLETLETEVRSSVHDASESVKERIQSFKRVFDVRYQAQEHPWVTIAAAAGVGYLAGSATTGSLPWQNRESEERERASTRGVSGWLQRRVGAEADRMRAVSYGLGLAFLRELIRRSLPPRISPVADHLFSPASTPRSGTANWPHQEI
jgi:ElaB/YqjD/DUF883 family membrane-anchored ribosome-binding protein